MITVTNDDPNAEVHQATYKKMGDVSDGYHTFDELYDHRIALFIALCQAFPDMAWRSKQHHIGGDPMYEGWFIAGLQLPTGDISYHLPISAWNRLEGILELDNAPAWDGHTPGEVLTRLNDYSGQLAMENA